MMCKKKYLKKTVKTVTVIFLPLLFAVPSVFAQGSIFGLVRNSDMSTPSDSDICFFGYLDSTDEEIRIESCTGAGYDSGHWYDDFQNYLTEVPGNPYDYYFFNTANGEGAILSGLIPDNSFQEENIELASIICPDPPSWLNAVLLDDLTVKLTWEYSPDLTYRIYRRLGPADGSLFRIDDPAGSVFNPGVGDSVYIDNTIDNISPYDYLVIPVDNGVMGRHSDIITIDTHGPVFLCGDADNDGKINMLDILFIIAFIYKEGPAPEYPGAIDIDGQPGVNLLDILRLVAFIYKAGPEPDCS
jgi:hypothetical protein